jgi:dTDP-4-dehydrorhamnose reductase
MQNKRRILITGASGLLGLNLALEAAKDHTVFGLVNNNRLNTDAFQIIEADLLEPGAAQRLLEATQPDWVIHCAALANLEACEADPKQAQELNSKIPGELALHVARGGARLIHVSTDAVFDGQRGEYTEEDSPNPLSIYAQTKLDGERAVAKVNPAAIIARVNLFGWSLLGKRSLGEFFVYNLQSHKPVKGFTDVYFCPLLANHLAHIFVQMLNEGLHGVYHVVSSECISKYDFGVAVARKFGLDEGLITPASWKEGGLVAARASNLTLRTVKLTRALGKSLPTISAGLGEFYTLYQQDYPQKLRQMVA